MRAALLAFTCLFLGYISCNNSGSNKSSGSDSTKTQAATPKRQPQSKLSDAGTNILMTMVNKYYNLKNALVATKAADADKAAAELVMAADSLEAFLQTDSINKTALMPYADTIITQGKAVTSVKDEDCEKKRLFFGTISSAIYGLAKNAGLKNAGIYHEYCPMAFNDKGAYWLSAETEIKNPYFGKKMLECGEVTDSL